MQLKTRAKTTRMMKDIFIDDNIAKNFANPADPEYIKLIIWLLDYSANPNQDAYLVVSVKLLEEYAGTVGLCKYAQNIGVIVDKLNSQGRLVKKNNKEIRDFRDKHYTKRICNRLTCSTNDQNYHIPTVLLSNRRYALSIDNNFVNDLKSFPGFNVTVAKRPQHINYR